MPLHFRRFLLLFYWLVGVCGTACAQDKSSLYVNPVLWSRIEVRFQQAPSPTGYAFIPQLVTRHFGNQPDSVYRNLYAIMIRLESRFRLDAAIYVGEELARIAGKQRTPNREATAYMNLSRYYDALGTYQLAAKNTEKALAIYRKLGDREAILDTEYHILFLKIHFVSREKIILLLEELLERAVAGNSLPLVRKIHLQLLEQTLLARNYSKAEQHVDYLDRLPASTPIKPQEYVFLINAALGRADLAKATDELMKAERYYQKALRLCKSEPSLWLEVFTLHALAQLEFKRGNSTMAKSYIEEAQIKAEQLQLHDLLIQIYALKSTIAEQDNNSGEALRFLQKKIFHEEKFNARSEGFNLENFYLQAERDKLAADEKNHELELSLKKSQLTYSIVILLLIALLAVGLVLGYLRIRRSKAELSRKNNLIQQHADQLQSLATAKSRFFANVSHELRTPLTLIVGPIGTLLKENQFSERQTTLLRAASRNAHQLKSMVSDILDLQKLEAGKMPIHLEPTELEAFFRIHVGQFESLAHSKQIHYLQDIQLATGLVAELDREKCRQIIYNLLSNAIKFTPAHGRIGITVHMQGSRLSFRVTDTGPGIHPNDLPHVFDRFFQTNRKGEFLAGGTGIGLSICHDYVRLFNGDIRVECKPGAGSVFYVSWPIHFVKENEGTLASIPVRALVELPQDSESFAESRSTQAVPEGTSARLPTILVVEDNPDLREYLRLILSEKYRIVTAEHGAMALQKMASRQVLVDLVLSDLMMPVMDGYQLLEQLKSDDATRHIPVIMLTARAEAADRLKALRIGVDDYLNKPFDEEELLVLIANLLKNQAVRSQKNFVENEVPAALLRLSKADQAWLEKFETYIRENLGSEVLTIPALGESFAMSESTLLRQLKRLTGLTPVQYLQEIRLNEARSFLEQGTSVPIATLASQVGYPDVRSFSRSFKKRFGKLPSDFV